MPVVTLSAEFVRTATCPEGKNKENYYDTATTGFILEVRASGGKTYGLRYRDSHNRQIQHKIGDAKSISFDKAKNAARKLRSEVELGVADPAEEKRKKKIVPTLEEFYTDRYLPYVKVYKKSWVSDASIFKNHLLPLFGNHHLDQIRHQEVVDLHQTMLDKGYAKATCNRAIVHLRRAYNLGKRWKIPGAESNPCADVPLFEPNNARERFLSVEETIRLHAELGKSENPQLKNIIALLLLTGCRKRELLDSKWEHFDLERRSWRIPMSKSGKARFVPMSSSVLVILETLPRWKNCPYVVPNPETFQPYTSIFRSWNTARKNAGLAEVRLHDLRHSMASNMVNSGRSIYEVANVLGHSQIKTTQRYAHLSQVTLLAAVDSASIATGVDWCQPA
jgi:integrase